MAETTLSVFLARAARHPEREALSAPALGGAPRDERLTWGEWHAASRAFAAALVASGVEPGDRVAILAGNRPLWPVADLGTLMAGAVSVGIYPTSAPAQVRQILADSGAVVAVTDTAAQLAKIRAVRAELPALRRLVCQEVRGDGVDGWTDWLALGAADEHALRVADARAAAVRAEDDALLIYTSGSTGEPKGARVTHRYLHASARSIGTVLALEESDTSISFLPFCHAAERVFGLHTRIVYGMSAALVADHTRLWAVARAYGPTLFGGVPRFFEKVWEELFRERAAARGAERARWDRVLELGARVSTLRRRGLPVPEALGREWRTAGEPLFQRAREPFGGRVRLATSGGAAFPARVAEELDALGLTVLGAYGLTEHLCVAFNRADRYTFDSAGPPMPGTELRVAADGEIQIRRGALTFSGYHGREEETRAAFTPDGEWLLTGDLGAVGEDGMLRVTGRRKELIALSTGKKVAPLPIEEALARHPWVEQAVVLGEGRKYVTALLSLRRPLVEAWAAEHGVAGDYVGLVTHPALRREIQRAVDAANALLSRTEQVRRFEVLENGLSMEADELTPTLKVRRAVVAERYRDRLDALYLLPER